MLIPKYKLNPLAWWIKVVVAHVISSLIVVGIIHKVELGRRRSWPALILYYLNIAPYMLLVRHVLVEYGIGVEICHCLVCHTALHMGR